MTSAQQRAALTSANCEIAFDNLTRQLYATDASIYQIEPVAVAFPRNTRQASALMQAAVQAGVSVTPRGAGTGLAGGAIGDGLVIDFSRYNRQITRPGPGAAHGAGGAGGGAGPPEQFSAAARLLRSGRTWPPARGRRWAA